MADRSVSVGRDAKRETFLDDIQNYALTVSPRATKFGMVTREEGLVSSGQPRPLS